MLSSPSYALRGQESIRKELPQARADILFKAVSREMVDAILENGVAVHQDFCDDLQAETALQYGRKLVLRRAPLSAARRIVNKLTDEDNLPDFLRRKPAQVNLKEATHMPSTIVDLTSRVQMLNRELWSHYPVQARYGGPIQMLTTIAVSRTEPKGEFGAHQDSIGISGLGYSLQTARTIWHARPSLTIEGADDFTFDTKPGDLVVLSQRAGMFPAEDFPDGRIPFGQGLETFYQDDSIVHDGHNLTDRSRYTLNYFHIER